MFENTDKIDLAKVEKTLDRSFGKAEMLGELRFTLDDYLRVARAVKESLNKNPENLEKIPERVFLMLLVFCARYEDTYASGYWPVFLERLGLRNDGGVRNACRKRFKEARSHLEHLYFPAEGYKYVTPILYHAVIPQVCVPEMASLLHKIGQDEDAGWDAVAEMGIEELERQLPAVVEKARATVSLRRFVNNSHSRRLAAQFVHDLCEAACLHQRGVYRLQEIESLLENYPVQREVWDKLMGMEGEQNGGATIRRALFVAPRWQWDIRSRQLRLFFPRQSISGGQRPASFVIGKERYPVEVRNKDGYWQLEPTCLPGMRIAGGDARNITVELRAENEACLRRWPLSPLSERALFFQPEASGAVATLIPIEKGLPAGECLALIRRNLLLRDEEGEVKASREWYAPRGFEDYQAVSVVLAPPVSVFAANDQSEELERILVAEESSRSLRLEGQRLPETDDPSGAGAFTGAAPDVFVAAQSWEEIKNLQLQLRDLTATDEKEIVARIHSIQSLRDSEIASWSETKRELQIQLGVLLPQGAVGRFRLKLLRGLQSAQYQPVEFNLAPAMRITPSAEEFDRTLYTAEEAPQVQIACPAASEVSSRTGGVTAVMPGIHRIEWPAFENDFGATLRFGDFSLPLRWRPRILRAGVYSVGSAPSWETQPLALALDELSFARIMEVEGMPEAAYQIYAGEVPVTSGRFNAQGMLRFPLAKLTDYVKRSAAERAPVRIDVKFGQREHQLLPLVVYKNSADRSEFTDGEPIRYLRVGRQALHPNYGPGVLMGFVEISVLGETINTARFHFDHYPGVSFFIPVNRRLPVYRG
ncbi:MAG: hypothetical protein MOB07_04925 [Acidobacteria bacterium]|nr:hypothetical protein [Acidobacteriota bacterium]